MKEEFIEVEKISEVIKKEDGEIVINPITKKPVIQDYESNIEGILISEIKSFRSWRKDHKQRDAFKGEVTIIYFKSANEKFKRNSRTGEERSSTPSMLINESRDSFAQRLGTIRLPDEHQEAALGRE